MSNRTKTRRQWLRSAAISATALLAGGAAGPDDPAGRRRAVRFAHLTDVHVEPERAAGRGMAACLALI